MKKLIKILKLKKRTGAYLRHCIQALEYCNWNLDMAIQDIMDVPMDWGKHPKVRFFRIKLFFWKLFKTKTYCYYKFGRLPGKKRRKNG